MQTSKKHLAIIFICLLPVLVGLACLTPVEDPNATDAPAGMLAPTAKLTVAAPSAAAPVAIPSAQPKDRCAMISADEALHLRQDSSSEAQVLAFMKSGEVVKLLSSKNRDWWLIKRGKLIGYARSRYLKPTQCR